MKVVKTRLKKNLSANCSTNSVGEEVIKKPLDKKKDATQSSGIRGRTKKTILLNPLSKSENSPLLEAGATVVAFSDLKPDGKKASKSSTGLSGSHKPKNKAFIDGNSLGGKAPRTFPIFDYGFIEYYDKNQWKKLTILNKNNGLGVFSENGEYYPLHSFKSLDCGISKAPLRGIGLPDAIGGVFKWLSSCTPSFSSPSIYGHLYGENSNHEIHIKVNKGGIKAIELAKFDVK